MNRSTNYIPSGGWYRALTSPLPPRLLARRNVGLAVGLVMMLTLLNLFGPAPLDVQQRLTASALIVMAAIPVWLWQSGYDRNIAFMPLFSIMYALYFAVPAFTVVELPQGARPPSVGVVTLALGLECLGLGSLLLGYYGVGCSRIAQAVPKIRLRWDNYRALSWLAYVLGTVGLVVYAAASRVLLPAALTEPAALLEDLALFAIYLLFALQLAGNLGTSGKCFLWGFLVPARMALGMMTTALAQAAMIPFALLLIYASVRRRFPWGLLALGIGAILIMQPVKLAARASAVEHGQRRHWHASISRFARLVHSALDGTTISYRQMEQIALDRLDMMHLFAVVIYYTPNEIPFWQGETYYPLLTKPIPRILYPSKFVEDFGNEFGRRYNMIARNDTITVVNLPQLVEAYANFGDIGVIVVMFVFGSIYRLLAECFVNNRMGIGGFAGAVFLLFPMIDTEHQASLAFGAVPFSLLFLGTWHVSYRLLSDLGRSPSKHALF